LPCVHEFGILDDLDKYKNYIHYELHKYNCISVHDEVIQGLDKGLSAMKTYFHSFSRSELGFAYSGITLIPPESLSLFYDIVTSSEYINKSKELSELALKILQATKEEKYMIHFGV
jgi:hypothetical protein